MPVSKKITKALKKRKKYRKNIIENLNMISEHIQCKRLSHRATRENQAQMESSSREGQSEQNLDDSVVLQPS